MPTFRYRAYNNAGKTLSGDIEATGPRDAATRLKEGGLFPIELTEAVPVRRGLLGSGKAGRVTADLLAHTTRQLSTLLSTGTILTEALGVISDSSDNPYLKKALLKVKESVSGGASLARALEDHPDVFSPFYRGLVASGEAGGSLDKVLLRLADYLETRARVLRDVRTALTYPILMTFVGGGVLLFLFIYVMPKITRVFEDSMATLPFMTLAIIKIADLLRMLWPLILFIIAGALLVMRKYRNHPKVRGSIDRTLLKTPWLGGVVTAFYVSSMARTLGSLLAGGVHILKALDITKTAVNHAVYSHILEGAITDCTGGGSLSGSIRNRKEMPPVFVHMVGVGERGGNLDAMLLKAADVYEEEFNSRLKAAVGLIEPLMILAMGAVVGFIVLAILLPIFELNQIAR